MTENRKTGTIMSCTHTHILLPPGKKWPALAVEIESHHLVTTSPHAASPGMESGREPTGPDPQEGIPLLEPSDLHRPLPPCPAAAGL